MTSEPNPQPQDAQDAQQAQEGQDTQEGHDAQQAQEGQEGQEGEAARPGPGLRASLEAILLVADEPVPTVVLAQVLEHPRNEVAAALRDLAGEYTAEGR